MLHQQWPYLVFEEIGRLFCREPWHRKPDAPDDEEEWIAECKTWHVNRVSKMLWKVRRKRFELKRRRLCRACQGLSGVGHGRAVLTYDL